MRDDEIVVYWSTPNVGSLRSKEPEEVLKEFSKGKDVNEYGYLRCPAFKDELENVFAVKSLFPVKVTCDNGDVTIDNTQDFFNENVLVRGVGSNLISILQGVYLFTEEPGLEVSQTSAFLDDNHFLRNSILVPGKMDISSWFRKFEASFHISKESNYVDIKAEDVIYYINFHTDKKIKFIRFEWTERLGELTNMCVSTRDSKGFVATKLSYFYDIFKRNNMKKKVMEEINKNLF